VSAALAGVLLVVNRALFRHGPDVPVAGRPEAWNVIWLVLGLVLLGHAVSVPTSLAWYLAVLRRGRRPGPLLTLASGYAVAITAALAWVFFWPHEGQEGPRNGPPHAG